MKTAKQKKRKKCRTPSLSTTTRPAYTTWVATPHSEIPSYTLTSARVHCDLTEMLCVLLSSQTTRSASLPTATRPYTSQYTRFPADHTTSIQCTCVCVFVYVCGLSLSACLHSEFLHITITTTAQCTPNEIWLTDSAKLSRRPGVYTTHDVNCSQSTDDTARACFIIPLPPPCPALLLLLSTKMMKVA